MSLIRNHSGEAMHTSSTRPRSAGPVLFALLLLCSVLLVVGASPAEAAGSCTAKPTRFYKADGTVIGAMKVSCTHRQHMIRIRTVFTRVWQGHDTKSFYARYRYCYDAFTCESIRGIQDVRGRQTYGFDNDPQGTMVTEYLDGSDMNCRNGITCRRAEKTF
jgi:hypothetical protein